MLNIFLKDFKKKNRNDYFFAEYELGTEKKNLKDLSLSLAIGQSIGNPDVRNKWETSSRVEDHSIYLLEDEKKLENLKKGALTFAFPLRNIDWKGDGISQLLCTLMGGQLDINGFDKCRLTDLEIPSIILKTFLGPKYGISGIRKKLSKENTSKPLVGGIVKPKTGLSVNQLLDMVKMLVDSGLDFIKEDEIMSNPDCCPLIERVEKISNYLEKLPKKPIYFFCINSDPIEILNRVNLVAGNGDNGVHVNFWGGLGLYRSIRNLNKNIMIHFQKSGDKILTYDKNAFSMSWKVICKIAAMSGVDTIHAGMYGGYLSDNENDLRSNLDILQKNNILPTLSCGVHPGLVELLHKKFGDDIILVSGGAIHGHPNGTFQGAKAMVQAANYLPGKEYDMAIKTWGKKDA